MIDNDAAIERVAMAIHEEDERTAKEYAARYPDEGEYVYLAWGDVPDWLRAHYMTQARDEFARVTTAIEATAQCGSAG